MTIDKWLIDAVIHMTASDRLQKQWADELMLRLFPLILYSFFIHQSFAITQKRHLY